MEHGQPNFGTRILSSLKRFWRESRGATAIEYGLIAALIAMALFVGLKNYYGALGNMFNYVEETTNNATN